MSRKRDGHTADPLRELISACLQQLDSTIRREYLDHVFFWNAVDLTRKLNEYRDYYNPHRVHRSLEGITPAIRAGASSPKLATLQLPVAS